MCSSGLPFNDNRIFERKIPKIKGDIFLAQDSLLVSCFGPETCGWTRKC